jgi:hypothetical protein
MILPRPLAARTWLLDGENGLLYAHLALAVAGIAGFRRRALRRSRAAARLALRQGRNLDLGLRTEYRLLEIDLEVVAQIRAAEHLGAAALAA